MVNGALVGEKEWTKWKYCNKGIKWIFLAYFWMFFFYFLVYPILGFEPMQDWHILLTPRAHRIYWFLFNLGIIYISWPYIKKWLYKPIFIGLLICPFVTNLVWDIVIYLNPNIIVPNWGHFGLYGLYTFFFFILGYLLRKCDVSKLPKIILVLCGLIAWSMLIFDVIVHSNNTHSIFDGVNALFPTMGAGLLSFVLFVFLKNIDTKSRAFKRYISFIGRNTIGIYIFHMFFILLLRHIGLPDIVNTFIAVFLSAFIVNLTALISNSLMKTKLVRFLMSA